MSGFPTCPRSSTCPPSSTRSSVDGGTARCSSGSLDQTAADGVDLLRARQPRTACPACTTSRRGFQGRFPRFKTMRAPRATPGGLGLPRPAGRGGRREGTRPGRQEGHRGLRHRGVQRAVPRVGAAARGRVRGDHRADGLLGRPVAAYGPWTRPTSSRSGGRSRSSSTRACWSGTTGSAPYCPRCGTPLSDHEMGQPDVYQTVTDPSVPSGSRCDPARGREPRAARADLLVWTTTPWTLVSNTAVAVHPDETYVVARRPATGTGWSWPTRCSPGCSARAGDVVAGSAAPSSRGDYQPPFELVEIPDAHRVVTGRRS